MRKGPFSLIVLLALLLIVLPMWTATMAREASEPSKAAPIDPSLRPQEPTVQRGGPVNIVIELNDAPTVEAYAAAQAQGNDVQAATAQAQQQLATVDRAQQSVLRSLQSAGIAVNVLYRTQRVYNGIAVKVDAAKLGDIAQLSGVKAIHRLIPKQLDNTSSVPLIGAPDVWQTSAAGANRTGQGIKIGIIDTGIDYIHTDFGGSGTGYNTNSPTTIEPGSFPTAKVVGGYDFVGNDYDANNPAKDTPVPDPDPLDCNGHGTHVAGTAAGYGVNANGSTYTGPWNTSTPFATLRIGPGVAPEAQLYALKVFGCSGSTNVTDLAIERAVDPNQDGDFADRLDVINMSLGSQYGSAYDTTAIASDNAALAGVVVVASAGNSGDTYYITGSPGTATRAVSVAGSVDALEVVDQFEVTAPAAIAKTYPGSNGQNYSWAGKPDVIGQLAYPAANRGGCQAFSATDAAALAGKIALLDWTLLPGGVNECGSATRVNNAQAAGAIGVILVYPDEVTIAIAGNASIPSTITIKSVGDTLKANLAAGVTVRLSASFINTGKLVDPARNNTVYTSSSRGPRRIDNALKPDLAAPGVSIFSADRLTGNQGRTLSGTSMAAPHVAGSMALLKQVYPDYTVEELKALAMNTSTTDVRLDVPTNSPKIGPGRIGAGRITLLNAAQAQAVAFNADEGGMVSVSFGAPEIVGSATATKNIRLINKGSSAATYDIAYVPVADVPGVSYNLSRSSVALSAGGYTNIEVTLTADATQMKHTRDASVAPQQQIARHWMSEEAGYVTLTPRGGGQVLRVPLYAAPRPASDMRAGSGSITFPSGTTPTGEIRLTGRDVNTGTNYPTDQVSVVTAFELQHTSPNSPNTPPLIDNADLAYVGVASNLATTDPVSATLAFGIATYSNWSTPNAVEFDIYIDTNRDGKDDFVLYNSNYGTATGGGATDAFVTRLINLNLPAGAPNQIRIGEPINGVPASALDTVPFNTNVMVLPIRTSYLGLTTGAFNYRIETFSRDNQIDDDDQTTEDESLVDRTPTLVYNPAQPGFDFSAASEVESVPVFLDLNNTTIPVRYNGEAFRANNSQGILLLHHLNTSGNKAEVITVQGNFLFKRFLPSITNTR